MIVIIMHDLNSDKCREREREREREEQRAWRGRGEIGRSEDVRHDG